MLLTNIYYAKNIYAVTKISNILNYHQLEAESSLLPTNTKNSPTILTYYYS